jgi:hypothetical protein
MTERRTNRGQLVDFDKLLTKQGDVPALGNMRVDGKGNQVENGVLVKTADQRVREHYLSVETTTDMVSLRRERPQKNNTAAEQEIARVKGRMKETAEKSKTATAQKEIHHPDGSIEVVMPTDNSENEE